MTLRAGKLDRSPRLQRVRDLLLDGREHSTLEIVQGAHVCAVNSVISELRANGLEIGCRVIVAPNGERTWLYKLVSDAPAGGASGRDAGTGPAGARAPSRPPARPAAERVA